MIGGEHAPDDDPEDVRVDIQSGLHYPWKPLFRVEVVVQAGVREREHNEVDPEAGGQQRVPPGRHAGRADGRWCENGVQPDVNGAAWVHEDQAADHHHLTEESEANLRGDEDETDEDEHPAEHSCRRNEHQ